MKNIMIAFGVTLFSFVAFAQNDGWVGQVHSVVSGTIPLDSSGKWSATATRIDLVVPMFEAYINFNYFGLQYLYAGKQGVQILAGTAHNTGPGSPQTGMVAVWPFGTVGRVSYSVGLEYYPKSTFPWYHFVNLQTSLYKQVTAGVYHEAGGSKIAKDFALAGPFLQLTKGPVSCRFMPAYDWVSGDFILRPSVFLSF